MRKLWVTAAIVMFATCTFAPTSGLAQTVAPGPYYAVPAWDQTLACVSSSNCPRFIVLSNMANEAVLDRETGLVWQRSPGDTNEDGVVDSTSDSRIWGAAQLHCNHNVKVGGRKGWRLPTIQELASLVDTNNTAGNPDLPPGHPFLGVQSAFYWSASTKSATDSNFAWFVAFSNGGVGFGDKALNLFVWCVRGGQGVDPQ